MILERYLEEWRVKAPWKSLEQVEQDLIISKALVELYNVDVVRDCLAFKGGTALNKLFLDVPARYSEDIDLSQIKSESIGVTLNGIREALDGWLGAPKWKETRNSVKFFYSYVSIEGFKKRLKVEINTTEHFHVNDLQELCFKVDSNWFSGSAGVTTFQFDELMAGKCMALYQRKKGRDLFDLWYVLERDLVDVDLLIKIFYKYCKHEGVIISRALFEQNLCNKRADQEFTRDIGPLLSDRSIWNFDVAFDLVLKRVISRLKGNAWKALQHN